MADRRQAPLWWGLRGWVVTDPGNLALLLTWVAVALAALSTPPGPPAW